MGKRKYGKSDFADNRLWWHVYEIRLQVLPQIWRGSYMKDRRIYGEEARCGGYGAVQVVVFHQHGYTKILSKKFWLNELYLRNYRR